MKNNFRKTKIVCTIGPAVDSVEMIKKLIQTGMNCARVNFSHGDLESKGKTIDRIKKAREELNLPIPILMDTKGPEIRIGIFKNGNVVLEKGQTFILDYNHDLQNGNEKIVYITYDKLYKEVKKGTVILIDDGKIELKVSEIKNEQIITKVIVGGKLTNRKSINIPNVDINMEYLSDVDKKDIEFAVKKGVDFIAASFVRRENDIIQLREYINLIGGQKVQLICKIENKEGVKNIDSIIRNSDGIMVARGDLGVEISFTEIPKIQKEIIEKCVSQGKFVITATQMLESMINSARPTRAEVSDVANAVYDGSSAVMLSGETAAGQYPIKAVQAMAKIASTAENSKFCKKINREDINVTKDIKDTICFAASTAAEYIKAKAIAVVTLSGATPVYFASFRPNCPVIALTVDEMARRQLNLRYGILPVEKSMQNSLEELSEAAITAAKTIGIAKSGDTIITVIGSQLLIGHPSDTIRILQLK